MCFFALPLRTLAKDDKTKEGLNSFGSNETGEDPILDSYYNVEAVESISGVWFSPENPVNVSVRKYTNGILETWCLVFDT